ncbi:hypothetical protein VTL71DRAFT_1997 [Oculimacula yallundae]|uniref:Glycosyltransferase 2-like domain-containing protein n=1 Tax=Oculimacula yallundae TaxID=86028 RepID=A0ABR4CD25_9HELO
MNEILQSAGQTPESELDAISFPPGSSISRDPFSSSHGSYNSSRSLPGSQDDHIATSREKLFREAYDKSEYTIEEVAPFDDIDVVKPWKRKLILFQPIVGILVFAAYGVYYGYRVWCNYQYRTHFGGRANASWIFIFAEGICIIPYGVWIMFHSLSAKERKRPKLRLRGDIVPAVDVLLTTCGEDVFMILNTIRAACNIDYPHNRFRIIICDDADDARLQEALRPIMVEFPFLFYNAREKTPGVPHHYKAGNLNSAINLAPSLHGGPGEYLATLDADMIPNKEWLRALLPHLILDPKMGLIAPPQIFYNAPLDDPLCQTMPDFINFLEIKKDTMGCAWCTGSGVVIKRFIVDGIGGWPVASMAEDQLLSFMMHGAGYSTAYLHEFMQVGMVPESIVSHLKQRTRWAVGTLESANACHWGLPGNNTKHMTLRQRLCIFTFAFTNIMMIPTFLCYLIIPALLYWGHDLMVYTTLDQLRWQIRLGTIWVFLLRVNDILASLPSGYIQAQRSAMSYQFMIPWVAVSILHCYILPKWLGGAELAFIPSGAIRDKLSERNSNRRANFLVRLKLIGWDCRVYVHLIFVGVCLGAAAVDWWRAWKIHRDSNDVVAALRHLLVNSMMAPLWWLMLTIGYLVPVVYILFPPSVPDREELWNFDPKTGVGYPKFKEMKQVWGVLPLLREIVWALTVVYCMILFVGTFVY